MLEILCFEAGHAAWPLVHAPLVAWREDIRKETSKIDAGSGAPYMLFGVPAPPHFFWNTLRGPRAPLAATCTLQPPPALSVDMLPNATAPTGRALRRLAVAGTASVFALPNAPTSKGICSTSAGNNLTTQV